MPPNAPKNVAEGEAQIREYLKRTGSDYTGPIPVSKPYTEESAQNYQGGAPPVVGYANQGNFSEAAPVDISVSIDPNTNRVQIAAPDFYVNSDHFKNNILPQFESLSGKSVSDPELNNFLQNNLTNYLKEDALRIGEYMQAVKQFESHVPGATEEDFNLYGTIANANKNSDDIMFPINAAIRDKDGKVKLVGEQSAKDWFKRLNEMNDRDRAVELASIRSMAESGSPTSRAAAMGLLEFSRANELNKAREFGSQFDSFIIGATEGLQNGLLTKGVSGATEWALGGDTLTSEQLRETPVFSELDNLRAADMAGNIAGTGTAIVGDLAAAGGAVKLAQGTGQLLTSIPAIGNVASKGSGMLSGVNRAVNSNFITRGVARETPYNLAFGALQSANNNGYDAPRQFLEDTAITAALLGVGRGLRPLTSAIQNSKTFQGVNEKSARALAKLTLAATSIPGVGYGSRKALQKVVDRSSAVRRSFKDAFANRIIDTGKWKDLSNRVSEEMSGAIGAADMAKVGSAVRHEAVTLGDAAVKSLSKMNGYSIGKSRDALADYVADRQILERIDKVPGFSERAGMTANDVQSLRDKVGNQMDVPGFEEYYNKLGQLTEEYVDHGVRLGVFDASTIQQYRDNGVNYVRLQRDVSGMDVPKFGSNNKPKNNLIKRTKKSDQSAIDSIAGIDAYLDEIFNTAAKRNITTAIRELESLGWKGAEVVVDAKQVRRISEIEKAKEAVETGIKEAVSNNSDELIRTLRNAVEEIDNIAGGGKASADAYEKLMGVEASNFSKAVVNNVADGLADVAEFADMPRELRNLMVADYMGSREGRAIIYKELSQHVGRALREDEWALLVDSIANSLTRIRRARESVATRSGFDAEQRESAKRGMRELKDEWSGHREDTSLNGQGTTGLVPYYEDGYTGWMRMKDPMLADYFNNVSTPAMDNMVIRGLNWLSRTTRINLTGASPVFLPVALARDLSQMLIMVGPNAASRNATLIGAIGQYMPEAEMVRLLDAIDGANRYGNYFEAGRSPMKALARTKTLSDEGKIQQRINQGRTGNIFKDTRVWAEGKAGSRAASAAENFFKHPITYSEEIFSMPEQYLRKKAGLAASLDVMQKGGTESEAIEAAVFASRNALTDFRVMGESMRTLNQITPYLNAMIQGQASFYRMLQTDPLGVATRTMSLFNLPVFMAMTWNLNDPERAAVYANMSDYDLENNLVIVIDGEVGAIKIPVPQEFRGVLTAMRESMEAWYQIDPQSFGDIAVKTFLNSGPLSLGSSINRGVDGEIDWGDAGADAMREGVGAFAPQAAQMLYSTVTGRDAFTGGQLNPDDERLIESGQVAPGQEITNADRTFRSRDSKVLGAISNALGIPQGSVQQFVRQTMGTNGQLALNALDKLAGAPEERQGGRGLTESLARRFFGTTQEKAETQFYKGLNDLEDERDSLETRLKASSKDFWSDPDQQEANYNLRQQLLGEYAKKVADFANNYDKYWQRVGGLKDWQRNRFVKLLNFDVDFGLSRPGGAEDQTRQQLSMDENLEAQRRAWDAGLDPFQMTKFFDGLNLETGRYETGNTPFSNMIRDQRYGAPKEMVADFKNAIAADKEAGLPKLKTIRDEYSAKISAVYARGNLGQADYDEIEALQNEYMQQFDMRMQPLMDKYGPLVFNNNNVINELRGMVMIPRSEWAESAGTGRRGRDEYISSKKFPNATADVRKILLERYGVGGRDVSNLPSDGEVTSRIESINSKLSAGRGASAMAEARNLQARINSGSLYANDRDISTINSLLAM